MRAAIGTPHPGLAGMARTHREARDARRVAELMGRRAPAVVRHRSVALTALLTSDPREAARFAEAELGALADSTEGMGRLRDTLVAYLEERQSPTRTARRLGVHENTVTYRIRQAETILGCSVDSRRLELETALLLARGLGCPDDPAPPPPV
jgi:DNA-binding PucR family transcriptional regulator